MGMAVSSPADGCSEIIAFDSERCEFEAVESARTTYLGRECLKLKGGIASLKGAGFTNGTVEFDMAFTEARGFMGGVWRVQDAGNYEEFYVRPHQSGKPDANQYTPVFNGVSGWQLYHGAGHGVAVEYAFEQWVHVKIVVSGTRAEVYFGDLTTPLLFVSELKRDIQAGGVGVSAGNFAPAYFSNFSFESSDEPLSKGSARESDEAPPGTVMSWLVSSTFGESSLENVERLDAATKRSVTWSTMGCEGSGIANIARVCKIGKGQNAAFVRLIILSDRKQTKLLRFGYSDRANVFLNDRLLYAGDNTYRSRDFRFLGTIGLFDGLYLALEEGRNELWIAVAESFGGWGVIAQFVNMDAITIQSGE
jgi:hypothetical protein